MFGPGKDQELFIANLQKAIGPVRQMNERTAPGDWVFTGTFRGTEVRVGLAGTKGSFDGVRYAAPMPGPMRIHVEAGNVTYWNTPPVPTGDPEFDQCFVVHGYPPEVVLAVLDAPMRRWFLDTYGTGSPHTDAENGWLSLYKQCRRGHGSSDLPAEDVPSPEEITHFLEVAVGLADRMTRGYAARRDEIARVQGPAAAEQWQAHHLGLVAASKKRREQLRMIIFGVVGALFVIPVLLAIVIIAASAIGSCAFGM